MNSTPWCLTSLSAFPLQKVGEALGCLGQQEPNCWGEWKTGNNLSFSFAVWGGLPGLGTRGGEVLYRARAAGELQGAEGCGVRRVLWVNEQREGRENVYMNLCDQRKDSVCFTKSFSCPLGCITQPAVKQSLFKENTGSFSLLMIKREMHKVTQSA